MKYSIILLLVPFFLGLKSPFPSTVSGISIPNTHQVDLDGKVLRGMAPSIGNDMAEEGEGNSDKQIKELIDYGITDVLIFKNEIRKEVSSEKEYLEELDMTVYTKPFLWKDIPSFQEACNYVVEAIDIIKSIQKDRNRKIFFHCTVGEDRTGLLAGIFRMVDQNWSVRRAFQYEMCINGYEHGNPLKPFQVVWPIRKDLTPLFQKIAFAVQAGFKLDKSVCANEAFLDQAISMHPQFVGQNYECEVSKLYPRKEKAEKIDEKRQDFQQRTKKNKGI